MQLEEEPRARDCGNNPGWRRGRGGGGTWINSVVNPPLPCVHHAVTKLGASADGSTHDFTTRCLLGTYRPPSAKTTKASVAGKTERKKERGGKKERGEAGDPAD